MRRKTCDFYARRFLLLYSADMGGWFIWDRLRYRMADGVYFDQALAEDVADGFERNPAGGDRDWYAQERKAYAECTWQEWRQAHGAPD